MHKSVSILTIFLIASPLIIFGPNSNIFSNAMAVENDYYYDETDQYENYAMDMANDNYYKSQGSDFIKKINVTISM